MTGIRGSAVVLLLGTCLLGGCAAWHAGTPADTLKLQTTTVRSGHATPLPADVWPGTQVAPQHAASGGMPPMAEGEPLGPAYEEGTASSSGQYQIKGSGTVKRVPGAGSTPKSQDSSHPTYSIAPSR